jgi:hypothetical protein
VQGQGVRLLGERLELAHEVARCWAPRDMLVSGVVCFGGVQGGPSHIVAAVPVTGPVKRSV